MWFSLPDRTFSRWVFLMCFFPQRYHAYYISVDWRRNPVWSHSTLIFPEIQRVSYIFRTAFVDLSCKESWSTGILAMIGLRPAAGNSTGIFWSIYWCSLWDWTKSFYKMLLNGRGSFLLKYFTQGLNREFLNFAECWFKTPKFVHPFCREFEDEKETLDELDGAFTGKKLLKFAKSYEPEGKFCWKRGEKLRERLWDFFENPSSSLAAKVHTET